MLNSQLTEIVKIIIFSSLFLNYFLCISYTYIRKDVVW